MISARERACLKRCGGSLLQHRQEKYKRWSDRHFCSYTQTENIEHFRQCVVRDRTVPMLVGWVAATQSFAKKSCACASIEFVAGINSLSVDSISHYCLLRVSYIHARVNSQYCFFVTYDVLTTLI